eukprot:TRINITY_DN45_c0_g1_i1.p1 TRINITY_DN45_c0_g1~~TRINITY_DN45_c0_g1_i1.p1  ORF type:complete len:528 (-),score=96.83 TRINITY_DN45_c0_g1_i1:327-1910(-)
MSLINTNIRKGHLFLFFLYQIAFIIIFRLCTSYADDSTQDNAAARGHLTVDYMHYSYMVLLAVAGYTFIYSTNDKGGYSHALSAFFVAGGVFQWGLLVYEFWDRVDKEEWNEDVLLNVHHMIYATFATVTVLISSAILSGYASPVQLAHLAAVEVTLYGLNIFINNKSLNSPSWEHHLWVHLFGAFFGLGALIPFRRTVKPEVALSKRGASDVSSFLGLVGFGFIFVFFPSFNAVLNNMENQERVIVNTYLALASSVLITAFYSVFAEKSEISIERLRTSALAAGVALSSSIATTNGPAAAAGTGLVAAIVAGGFARLDQKLGDASGAFSAHFAGALVGGVGTMISLADAYDQGAFYGVDFNKTYSSAGDAADNHVASFFITIGISLFSGLFFGFIFATPFFQPKSDATSNEDNDYVADSCYAPEAPATRAYVAPVAAPAPAPIPVPVAVPVPAPKPVVTRTILGGFNTAQTADWLRSVSLTNAASLVTSDEIVGQDLLDSPADRLNAYFGQEDGSRIWIAIGAMAP